MSLCLLHATADFLYMICIHEANNHIRRHMNTLQLNGYSEFIESVALQNLLVFSPIRLNYNNDAIIVGMVCGGAMDKNKHQYLYLKQCVHC